MLNQTKTETVGDVEVLYITITNLGFEMIFHLIKLYNSIKGSIEKNYKFNGV